MANPIEEIKQIPLTQGKVAIVDADDYEHLMQWKWFAKKNMSGTFYAVTYMGNRKIVRMHWLIMGRGESMVDHINGDGLDNRKKNLRLCNWLNNCHNKKVFKNNTTGFKGITKRWNGKYQAQIVINYKKITIGTYLTPEDAARAYDAAAIEHYGEYAKTNEMLGLLGKPVIYQQGTK